MFDRGGRVSDDFGQLHILNVVVFVSVAIAVDNANIFSANS